MITYRVEFREVTLVKAVLPLGYEPRPHELRMDLLGDSPGLKMDLVLVDLHYDHQSNW